MLWAQRPYESLIATIPLACLLAFPKFPQSVEAPNAAANMITWSESEEATDEFYESLDRILSSSCSSTSTSDDEGDLYRRRRSYLPLPSAASYNAWLCEPASVKERRRRLLHHMGLAVDPDLARLELEGDAAELSRSRERELGRSASCDGLCPHLISPSPSPLPSPSPIAIPSHGSMSRSISDFSVCDGRSPLVGRSKVSYGDFDHRKDERRCTIRDLDNGKEFVVIEFNGIRNQLREVGTGRKLTMDEFEACVGRSPIVQELMRRQIVEDGVNGSGGGGRYKRRSSWFKSFKCVVATGRERRSSDEKDSSSERGGRRSSSATDDSQDMPPSIPHGPEWTKIRRYGKTRKELTGLYMGQEIQAHDGSIWTIKFSLDGSYLASAGEDCVIHVWQVLEREKKWGLLMDKGKENGNYYSGDAPDTRNGDVVPAYELASEEASYWEKTTRTKRTGGRKPVTLDNLVVPRQAFALAERPVCTFRGHLGDVLNLSWSKSQHVLSSSMDKTVRLWHLSSNSCLKIFSHMDYVTCIQFNPVDDRYFISGSLDAKIRLWSIPDRQIVDWNDLHEMVTAVCYSPDGQGALVGSHKGNCHFFDTSDNKLVQKKLLDLQNKRKKSSRKKITGLQFAPGSSTEVLITSADSRIRVVDENDLIHKFKGFRNTSSQISACFTECGEHVICASEDSQVYLWRYDAIVSKPCGSKGAVRVTRAYEYFRCPSVTAALPWPAAVFSASVHGSKPQAKDRGIVIVASTRGGEIRTFQNLIP